MLIRLLLLSLLFSGLNWGEDAFPKWASTKNSLIDINWTNKDGERIFFLIHTEGYITVRTGSIEKRGKFTDKNDKAISSFVKFIYDLKKAAKMMGKSFWPFNVALMEILNMFNQDLNPTKS